MTIGSKSTDATATKVARAREVRDLYNKLRVKYKHPIVDKFFKENYFIQPRTVEIIVQNSDHEPVDLATASVTYRICISDDFYL